MNIPVIDRALDGVWPDRFAGAAIDGIQCASGPNRFRSQMILTPGHTHDVRLDPDRLVRYERGLELHEVNGEQILTIEGRRMVSTACWWDPAMARPKHGDTSVVAAVFTDDCGGYWLNAIQYLQLDETTLAEVDAATQLSRQVIAFLRAQHQPVIAIETNGIGGYLPGLLRRELADQQLAVTVTEQVSVSAKDQRILSAFDPILAARALRAHASVWETPFIREMREWLPGGRGQDDGLDAVSGCILAQPVRLGARRATPPRRDWRHTGPLRATTGFEI